MPKVFVLKTEEMGKTLAFFQELGLEFVEEQHGSGPIHYACEQNGVVFEIYPSTQGTSTKFFD